ncbi:MAG TPA: ABC transporter permease subunit [Desulfobacteria bacterium]|nr:ABC transporter permease subunit [Desulfobacteria bacterium]
MKAMLKKEVREVLRSYRWLLLPCIFIFLGLGQPITNKFMPEIIKNTKLPPGTVMQIPIPPADYVVSSILPQFSQLGVLMIILSVMGTVAQEKTSGVAAGTLVKPVGRGTYLLAKFVVHAILTVIAYTLGLGIGAYYTQVLIGKFAWLNVVQGGLVFLPYLLLTVALTILTSTLFASQLAAGGTALFGMLAVTLLPNLAQWSRELFPGALSNAAQHLVQGNRLETWNPVLFTCGLITACLVGAWLSLRRQEL